MKKILFLILTSFTWFYSYSQEQDITLDQMLVNVDKSSVTSGIIYERVPAFANLYKYNSTLDTADADYFEQSFHEFYNASNQTKFISVTALRKLYSPGSQTNVIDIGILNSQYSYLNYNSNNPSLGGLTLSNNQFYQISGQPPFIQSSITMISPLKENAVGSSSFTFNIKSNLWFTNGIKAIKNITAVFGDGVSRNIILNGAITLPTVTVNYTQSGYKYLKFTITYNDNSTHITYGTLYVKVTSTAKTTGADPLTEDLPIDATIPFKGYNESTSTLAHIECRIFYSNGNTQKKIMKPIIISDGFDPGDKRKIQASDYIDPPYVQGVDRSIEDFNNYTDCNGVTQNLITILRSKGYDVIVVNYPTYTDLVNNKTIDGGADFIERNAMAMIALIQKINAELATNGSTQQLVIVGPSMGGQITRYALAYMEKQYAATNNTAWLHKTRLWISVDSPNLGANIPEGLQALINLLKKDSQSAEDFYTNRLGSAAAKQQLINWHQQGSSYYDVNTTDMNGRTISQGFTTNSGSAFFQQFYNNEFNNGLAGSKGYPMNLRKICLVNGSVTGKIYGNGTDNQQTLNDKVFTNVCAVVCWDVMIANLESFTLPAFGNDQNIAHYKSLFYNDRHTHAPNNDSRGNVDILPGGLFDGYDQLDASVHSQQQGPDYAFYIPFYIGLLKSDFGITYQNSKVHCFIPSFSALGMKDPNQDWGQSLKRNLVCSKEIPFDSYFGHDDNTPHTSFDCESVNWLLKELGGTQQAPWFPMSSADLTGPTNLCLNIAKKYKFSGICDIPSAATWTVTSNLQITSSNGTSITIQGTNDGVGTITATFSNGIVVKKDITLGTPKPDAICGNRSICYQKGNSNSTGVLTVCTPAPNTTYSWKVDNEPWQNVSQLLIVGGEYEIGQHNLSVKGTNSCGTSQILKGTFQIKDCSKRNIKDTLQYVLFPNPASHTLQIKATGSKGFSQIHLTDKTGNIKQVYQFKTSVKIATISVSSLSSDVYYIQIFDGTKWIGKKLLIER